MKMIIGLGNPGEKYKNNRHNVGFLVVDQLKTEITNNKTQNSKQIKILKSDKFMNDSGSFVSEMLKAYGIQPEALYVILDDLDIKLGEYKIQLGRGPKVHNGLNDIYEKLGTKDFWHVRVGIENRIANNVLRIKGEQYVLEDFTDSELEIIQKVNNNIVKELTNK